MDNNIEYVINERKIMWFSFALLIALISFMYLPVTIIWGWSYTLNGLSHVLKHLIFWLLPIIIVHEGLHGIIWAITSKEGFRQIKFGFNKEMMAPYTHCRIPLNRWAYIAGGVAPLLIIGVFPAFLGLLYSNPYWYCLSLFSIWSSAGDILSCYYVLKVQQGYKILDHPEKLGFILIPI
jgi:hypothetical protein